MEIYIAPIQENRRYTESRYNNEMMTLDSVAVVIVDDSDDDDDNEDSLRRAMTS